jgi:hypothetical protein
VWRPSCLVVRLAFEGFLRSALSGSSGADGTEGKPERRSLNGAVALTEPTYELAQVGRAIDPKRQGENAAALGVTVDGERSEARSRLWAQRASASGSVRLLRAYTMDM